MSISQRTTYFPQSYDPEIMANAIEAHYMGEPASQVAKEFNVELRHLYYTIAQDKQRNHIIPVTRKQEIQVLREIAQEDKRVASVARWSQVRDMQLDVAIDAIPKVSKTVDTPGKLYQTVVSAAIATEKAAALAGEPLGTVEHRHTGKVRHGHVVVHVPLYQPEEYGKLVGACELQASAVIIRQPDSTAVQGESHENGDTPAPA